MTYEVISTGSVGNAVIVDGNILCDCGVSYKALAAHILRIRLVLLTHIHGDHFKPSTIRRIAKDRPTLRFGCCPWLAAPLKEAGVPMRRIDVYHPGEEYRYGEITISPVPLVHNVPQCGYKIHTPRGRAIYCTDTSSLDGIEAKGYDLYLIEANYTDEDIRDRIERKTKNGEYVYEYEVLKNHLSRDKCEAFIAAQGGDHSEYVCLHEHREREVNPSCRDASQT